MNFDLIKKIPILAKETKEKFSKALTTLQTDESSYFFNESLKRRQILEFLNSNQSGNFECPQKDHRCLFSSSIKN